MTIYNTKHTQLFWNGITLDGFASQKISIKQTAKSTNTYIGIFGESINLPNPKRIWNISAQFLVTSAAYKILAADNLLHNESTLIIRDLNLGSTDIFTNCAILSIGDETDSSSRSVIWIATKRNGL